MKNINIDNIIDTLLNKKGFDDWWFSIDEETQEEIKQDIEYNIWK